MKRIEYQRIDEKAKDNPLNQRSNFVPFAIEFSRVCQTDAFFFPVNRFNFVQNNI